MGRYVALLRGINVGGHHKLPMADLRRVLGQAGCTEVTTYIQSGNAVFDVPTAKGLEQNLAGALEREFGFAVPVVMRSAKQFAPVVASQPFDLSATDPKWIHVMFLSRKPSKAQVAKLDPARSPADEFEVHGAEIYVRFGKGSATSKFTNAYVDQTLGLTSTSRNWRTVLKLQELL